MPRFRKKPVVIDALPFLWERAALCRLAEFCGAALGQITRDLVPRGPAQAVIHTLEGPVTATEGDWIILDARGEFYPCKPEIFDATYDKVIGDDL